MSKYKCEQCGSNCVTGGDYVICEECNYEVPKDTADKIILLEAAEEIIRDFNTHGEVLQQGDNGEYGCESAIGRLVSAVEIANI